jgi:hypothetical protein
MSFLAGVSCSSASACLAVGFAYGPRPLGERWNGKRWSVEQIPGPVSAGLAGVSCVSETACTAVGVIAGDFPDTLAEGWNGSSWAIEQPFAGGSKQGDLTAVSCGSRSACTAVGSKQVGGGRPVVERWNGKAWVSQRTPTSTAGLASVSCPSATLCTAVGDYNELSWPDEGTFTGDGLLAERWNGTSWWVQQTPSPAGATNIGLAAVSCPTLTACTTVGSYKPTGNRQRVLVERWTHA